MKGSTVLIICLIIGLLIFLKFKFTRKIKWGTLSLVTGGVKTGKSMLAVYAAVSEWKSRHFRWRLKKWRCERRNKHLSKKCKPRVTIPEEPLLYSNTPLGVPCCSITQDMLLRKTRPNYGSVFYIDEASLLTDSMDFKDGWRNECIELFNKLFGHETCGGCIFYDTQNIADNHKGIRRNLTTYENIFHTVKWLPFVVLMQVREMTYDEDGNTINVNDGKLLEQAKWVVVPKKVWKWYDRYCYSFLTDNLPREAIPRTDKLGDPFEIISFRNFKTIPDEYIARSDYEKDN